LLVQQPRSIDPPLVDADRLAAAGIALLDPDQQLLLRQRLQPLEQDMGVGLVRLEHI